MRHHLLIAILILLGANAACALPPIIIYNYAPPPPGIELVSISPENHQQLNVSPASVTASFSQAIDPVRSDIKIFDPYNNSIGGQAQSLKGTELRVLLPANLLAGVYRVEWKATCSCKGNPAVNGTTYFTIY